MWDRTAVEHNIDVFSMSALPNAKNGEYLEGLCMEFNLSDPFRMLYPGRRAFSYSPFGTVRRNRSRQDFFVVSKSLIPNIVDCSISPGLATKLFDHRTVLLTLGTKKKGKTNSGPRVGNKFLTKSYVRASVNIAAIKCHVHSLAAENNQKIDLIKRCTAMGVNLAEIRGLQQKIATKGTVNLPNFGQF